MSAETGQLIPGPDLGLTSYEMTLDRSLHLSGVQFLLPSNEVKMRSPNFYKVKLSPSSLLTFTSS